VTIVTAALAALAALLSPVHQAGLRQPVPGIDCLAAPDIAGLLHASPSPRSGGPRAAPAGAGRLGRIAALLEQVV